MMVTVAGGDVALQPLLTTLNCKTSGVQDKVEVYNSFSIHLKDDVDLLYPELEQKAGPLLAAITRDIMESTDVAPAALQTLGFILHDSSITGLYKKEDVAKLLANLTSTLLKTTDKTTCTRALWCLAKQTLDEDFIKDEVHSLLCAIEHTLTSKAVQSVIVEHEALNAVIRLLEQVPENMKSHAVRWSKLIYPMMVHGAAKVRDRALVAMQLGMPAMMEHQAEIAKTLVPDLKTVLIGELKKLMSSKHEIFCMKVWSYYIKLLGKALHHGTLINHLLPVAELAFKNSSPDVKCAAFKAWRTLIDNFALNPDILLDQRRVKLVMQVLRINNAKVETVAVEKFNVWWHFVLKLGDQCASYFDQVCIPLLNFCVGSSSVPGLGTPAKSAVPSTPKHQRLAPSTLGSPATPHMNLSGVSSSPCTFQQVQLKGCEVVAQILGKLPDGLDIPKAKYTIDELQHDIITGISFFIKHAQVLIAAVRTCLSNLGPQINDGLLCHLWYSLVAHVKNTLEVAAKKDNVDIFTAFLLSFQHIVTSQGLHVKQTMKLFQAVVCLPPKALASSVYHVGNGEVMQGCPALFLLENLLKPDLMEAAAGQERYFSLMEKLVVCGMTNQRAALGFCQSVLQAADRAVAVVRNSEDVWRMWSLITHPLLEHVVKSNEVNQGDSLEHDFSCLYIALLMPLKHCLKQQLTQATIKTMLKTWGELYKTFSRLAALVANAEGNVWCEELSGRILTGILSDKTLKDVTAVDGLLQAVQVMVDSVDFSTFSNQFSMANFSPMSPGKYQRKKQKPLGNLHSLVSMLGSLIDALVTLGSASPDQKGHDNQRSTTGLLQAAAMTTVHIVTTLFTHVSQSVMISVMNAKLAAPLGRFFDAAAKKSTCRMVSTQLGTKIEKLWLDMTTCLQGRFNGQYDSEMLQQLAPLLEVMFLYPRRQVKNQTALMWNATFARGQALQYPDSLKAVLMKVKEKTTIHLPGWNDLAVPVIDETPCSEMSQGESQAAVPPNIVGIASPHKTHGSFMNKVVSPNIKNSPLKPSRSPGAARRKLPLIVEDMESRDFVPIPSIPKRKRVLTDHQKEVLKQRSVVPAMYNDLEMSQDRSVQFPFATDSDSQTPTPVHDLSNPFATFSMKKQMLNDDTEKVMEVTKEVKQSLQQHSETDSVTLLPEVHSVIPDEVIVLDDSEGQEGKSSVKPQTIKEQKEKKSRRLSRTGKSVRFLVESTDSSSEIEIIQRSQGKSGGAGENEVQKNKGSASSENQQDLSGKASADEATAISDRDRSERESSPSEEVPIELSKEVQVKATAEDKSCQQASADKDVETPVETSVTSSGPAPSIPANQLEAFDGIWSDKSLSLLEGSDQEFNSDSGKSLENEDRDCESAEKSQLPSESDKSSQSQSVSENCSQESVGFTVGSPKKSVDSPCRSRKRRSKASHSPRRGSPGRPEGTESLDRWITKSPRQKVAPLEQESMEDSQQDTEKDSCPGKTSTKTADICVEETPLKEETCISVVDCKMLTKSTRNLTQEMDEPTKEILDDLERAEDSKQLVSKEIMDQSEECLNVPSRQSTELIKLAKMPVLVLHKLTKDVLQQYSPKKCSQEKPQRMGTSIDEVSTEGTQEPDKSANLNRAKKTKKRRSLMKLSRCASMENDDMNEIQSLDSDDIIPSSQASNDNDIDCVSEEKKRMPSSETEVETFGGKSNEIIPCVEKKSSDQTNNDQNNKMEQNTDDQTDDLNSSYSLISNIKENKLVVCKTKVEAVLNKTEGLEKESHSNCEKEISDNSERLVESMEIDDSEQIVDLKTLPSVPMSSIISSQSEEGSGGFEVLGQPSENPDIIPVDLASSEELQNSNATIITPMKSRSRRKSKPFCRYCVHGDGCHESDCSQTKTLSSINKPETESSTSEEKQSRAKRKKSIEPQKMEQVKKRGQTENPETKEMKHIQKHSVSSLKKEACFEKGKTASMESLGPKKVKEKKRRASSGGHLESGSQDCEHPTGPLSETDSNSQPSQSQDSLNTKNTSAVRKRRSKMEPEIQSSSETLYDPSKTSTFVENSSGTSQKFDDSQKTQKPTKMEMLGPVKKTTRSGKDTKTADEVKDSDMSEETRKSKKGRKGRSDFVKKMANAGKDKSVDAVEDSSTSQGYPKHKRLVKKGKSDSDKNKETEAKGGSSSQESLDTQMAKTVLKKRRSDALKNNGKSGKDDKFVDHVEDPSKSECKADADTGAKGYSEETNNKSENIKDGPADTKDVNIFNQACNLDMSSDSEEDMPLTMLNRSDDKPLSELKKVRDADIDMNQSIDDDLPLTVLKKKEAAGGVLPPPVADRSEAQPPRSNTSDIVRTDLSCHEELSVDSPVDNLDTCQDLFPDSVRTSTPSKEADRDKKKTDNTGRKDNPIKMIELKGSQRKGKKRRLQKIKNSPLSSRLRSGRSVLRSKAVLNKSLDSSLITLEKSKKRKFPETKNKDDSALEEKIQMVTSSATRKHLDDVHVETELEKDSRNDEQEDRENVKTPGSTPDISSVSTENQKAPNSDPDPIGGSKQTEVDETPRSAGKYRSRAHMILERAKLISKTKISPTSQRKILTPSRSGVSASSMMQLQKGRLKEDGVSSPERSRFIVSTRGSPPASRTILIRGSPSFRPVHIPRVYSPSASPSAGILKRRRLSGEQASNSPSPPNKQRRVSFAEPVEMAQPSNDTADKPVSRCLDMVPSPLVTTTPSRVITSQSKFITTACKPEECKVSPSEDSKKFALPQRTCDIWQKRKEWQGTQSQSSLQSVQMTQESQLDCHEPIYPELMDCDKPVEAILPQLTSSIWVRGLGQLVRAKNIKTVGDLSALTQYDIHNLPIRSPKLETVQQALRKFQTQQGLHKGKSLSTELKQATPDKGLSISVDTEQVKDLADVEEELAKLSPNKADNADTSVDEDMGPALELLGANSTEEQEEQILSCKQSESVGQQSEHDQHDTDKPRSKKEIMSDIKKLSKELTPEFLEQFTSNQLMQIQQHLNAVVTNIFMAMKQKCPSTPGDSQLSQE